MAILPPLRVSAQGKGSLEYKINPSIMIILAQNQDLKRMKDILTIINLTEKDYLISISKCLGQ